MKIMNVKSRLLFGAAIGLALAAQAAPVSAQERSTTAAPAKPRDSATVDEVVVTGIRATLKAAQDIKRDADEVLEAVTATDLGRFDDNNIADALQRVPGVQIERDDTALDGDRVSIRGLGPNFVLTTFAGRTPVSSGSGGVFNLRSFNFDVVPTELMNGLLVMKTGTADKIEQGLAGTVDVQLLRPLAARYAKGKDVFGSAEVRGVYQSLSKKVDPRYSMILGGRNADRSLGFYVSGVTTKSHAPNANIRGGGYVPAGTAGFLAGTRRGSFVEDTNNNGVYDNGDTWFSNGATVAPTFTTNAAGVRTATSTGGGCVNGFAPPVLGLQEITSGPLANNQVKCDTRAFDVFFGDVAYTAQDITRRTTGLSGGLQWKPTDRLEINVDAQHSDLKRVNYTNIYSLQLYGNAPLNGQLGFMKPGSVYFSDEGPTSNRYITGFDGSGFLGFLGSDTAGAVFGPTATTTNFRDVMTSSTAGTRTSAETKLDMGGINLAYKAGRFKATVDLSASRNTYDEMNTQIAVRQRFINPYSAGDIGYKQVDGYPVVVNSQNLVSPQGFVTTDVLNSARCATIVCTETFTSGSLFVGATPQAQFNTAFIQLTGNANAIQRWQRKFEGTNYAARADLEYDLDRGIFTKLLFGARYSDTELDSITSVRRRYAMSVRSDAIGATCVAAQGSNCLLAAQTRFVNDVTHDPNGQTARVTVAQGTPAAISFVKVFDTGACATTPTACTDTLENGGLISKPDTSYKYQEKIFAPYAAVKFRIDRLIFPITGNLGVRFARTEWNASAGRTNGYNIVITSNGSARAVKLCKPTPQASLAVGACPEVRTTADARFFNTGTGTIAANGAVSAGSSGNFNTINITNEINSGYDQVYYNIDPGSWRNPFLTQVEGKYWNVLPSLNLNVALRKNLRLRFGYGEVVSRPNPNEIAPTSQLNVTDDVNFQRNLGTAITNEMAKGLTYEDAVKSASVAQYLKTNNLIVDQGNPDLKPYTARNYDVTLEWYTPNKGSIIAGAFRKDVKDYIVQVVGQEAITLENFAFNTSPEVDPIFDARPDLQALNGKNLPFLYRRYENYSDAKVWGYEISANQPFSFLPKPFDRMGVNANYTYVQSKFAKDVGNGKSGFPGASPNNVNVILYYDGPMIELRGAYNYRDAYVSAFSSLPDKTRYTAAQSYFDFSATYKPTPMLQIRASANNISGQDRYDYATTEDAILNRYTRNKVYSLSLRYRY